MKFETIICPSCHTKFEVNVSNNHTVFAVKPVGGYDSPSYSGSGDSGSGIIYCPNCDKKLKYWSEKSD